jgi:hypothetical protein
MLSWPLPGSLILLGIQLSPTHSNINRSWPCTASCLLTHIVTPARHCDVSH